MIASSPPKDALNRARSLMNLEPEPVLEGSDDGCDPAAVPVVKCPKTTKVVQGAVVDGPMRPVPAQTAPSYHYGIFLFDP